VRSEGRFRISGVDTTTGGRDRRIIFAAIINCLAQAALITGGQTANNVPVAEFGKFFMSQPVNADGTRSLGDCRRSVPDLCYATKRAREAAERGGRRLRIMFADEARYHLKAYGLDPFHFGRSLYLSQVRNPTAFHRVLKAGLITSITSAPKLSM
jgi:hypothetical protein